MSRTNQKATKATAEEAKGMWQKTLEDMRDRLIRSTNCSPSVAQLAVQMAEMGYIDSFLESASGDQREEGFHILIEMYGFATGCAVAMNTMKEILGDKLDLNLHFRAVSPEEFEKIQGMNVQWKKSG